MPGERKGGTAHYEVQPATLSAAYQRWRVLRGPGCKEEQGNGAWRVLVRAASVWNFARQQNSS
eukprot:13042123-Heterocapsa_arctica.AAC.1